MGRSDEDVWLVGLFGVSNYYAKRIQQGLVLKLRKYAHRNIKLVYKVLHPKCSNTNKAQ